MSYPLLARRAQSKEDNWQVAEQYVKPYYGNILTAVIERSTAATRAVVQAVGSEHALVNTFEAAVDIFFTHPETIRASASDLRHLI